MGITKTEILEKVTNCIIDNLTETKKIAQSIHISRQSKRFSRVLGTNYILYLCIFIISYSSNNITLKKIYI